MEQVQFDWILKNQENHWWFFGRNQVILHFLKKYILKKTKNSFLDIGTGYGATMTAIQPFASEVDAIEPFEGCHEVLKQKNVKNIHLIHDFPHHFPSTQYDVVCLFDVLEHIEEDQLALKTIHHNLLTKDGQVLITVPAYKWLWTVHDTKNLHFRRYTLTELKEKLAAAGFTDIRISYFMFFLFPLAVIHRLWMKIFPPKLDEEFSTGAMNGFFKKIFSIESKIISIRFFPFGLSIIAIAKKN